MAQPVGFNGRNGSLFGGPTGQLVSAAAPVNFGSTAGGSATLLGSSAPRTTSPAVIAGGGSTLPPPGMPAAPLAPIVVLDPATDRFVVVDPAGKVLRGATANEVETSLTASLQAEFDLAEADAASAAQQEAAVALADQAQFGSVPASVVGTKVNLNTALVLGPIPLDISGVSAQAGAPQVSLREGQKVQYDDLSKSYWIVDAAGKLIEQVPPNAVLTTDKGPTAQPKKSPPIELFSSFGPIDAPTPGGPVPFSPGFPTFQPAPPTPPGPTPLVPGVPGPPASGGSAPPMGPIKAPAIAGGFDDLRR